MFEVVYVYVYDLGTVAGWLSPSLKWKETWALTPARVNVKCETSSLAEIERNQTRARTWPWAVGNTLKLCPSRQ